MKLVDRTLAPVNKFKGGVSIIIKSNESCSFSIDGIKFELLNNELIKNNQVSPKLHQINTLGYFFQSIRVDKVQSNIYLY